MTVLVYFLLVAGGLVGGVGVTFLWFDWQSDRTTNYDIDQFLTALATDPGTRNLTIADVLHTRTGSTP